MKKFSNFIFVIIVLCFSLFGNAQGKYILKSGDVNGINKWYMGRQIAQVMSHYGIEWLEREERDKEENTSLLLKNLNVQPGMMIADIGAGSGYHSTLLSKRVGSGKVYAVDVELEMIAFLKDRIKAEIDKRTAIEKSKLFIRRLSTLVVNIFLLILGWGGIIAISIYNKDIQSKLSGVKYVKEVSKFVPPIALTVINAIVEIGTKQITTLEAWDFKEQMIQQ
jgi:2-polyprenyl-3-methyl-5-hydroxy-6-metoxy-1,4-benzoquinol methylase